jgi:hypothetical protein
MAAQQQQDLQVQQKREVEKKQEGTIPAANLYLSLIFLRRIRHSPWS